MTMMTVHPVFRSLHEVAAVIMLRSSSCAGGFVDDRHKGLVIGIHGRTGGVSVCRDGVQMVIVIVVMAMQVSIWREVRVWLHH